MATRCPQCNSRYLRRAHRQGMLEHVLSHCSIYPCRCGVCSHRFFKAINWRGDSSRLMGGRSQKHVTLYPRESQLATAVPRGRPLRVSDRSSIGRADSAVHVIVFVSLVLSMVIVSLLIATWPSQATLYMR